MITPFTLSSLPVTPWKNGLGETREIVCEPSPDAPFLWRTSIATLQNDGPFSRFEGVDRVIVLLEGNSFWLRGDVAEHYLEPGEPWAFAGEWPLASEGISGPGKDFNIMTQRSRAKAQVEIVTTSRIPQSEGVVYILSGTWHVQGVEYQANEGLCWQDECPGELVPHSENAALILAEIRRENG